MTMQQHQKPHPSFLRLGAVFAYLAIASCGDPPPSQYPTAQPRAEEATIGAGDRIRLRIEYGGASADQIVEREYSVDESGQIAVPYIDLVTVIQKTPAQVRLEIKDRLADGYLRHPIVQVDVLEGKSTMISVMGEVKTPNQYPYAPGMTILEALSRAGGFTPMARKNAVTVRRIENGTPRTYTVPAEKIQSNKAENFPMRPGDVVEVPQRAF